MSEAQNVTTSQAKASTPVEMGTLSTAAAAQGGEGTAPHDTTEGLSTHSIPATESEVGPSSEPQIAAQSHISDDDMAPLAMPQPALLRTETEAIGPSTDLPTPMLAPSTSAVAAGPTIVINLLLTSTGTRHPYKIDEKYLAKRNVTAEGEDGAFDPFVISVYTLKELIWRDWREGMSLINNRSTQALANCLLVEWEPRPSSPSAIRLIHFGRLLDDKLPLKGTPSPHVRPHSCNKLTSICSRLPFQRYHSKRCSHEHQTSRRHG